MYMPCMMHNSPFASLSIYCLSLPEKKFLAGICVLDLKLLGLLSVVYCAARSATDSKAMDEFELVTYNYSFFHLIFALASMYIAMLMTGWGTGAEEKDLIDVGWTSVWVKIIAQWATVALYAWTMTAPLLFPDRDFS